MNKLRLTFLSLLLTLGVSVGFAQQYGNNSARNSRNHSGRSGNMNQGHRGQGNQGHHARGNQGRQYSQPAQVNSRRGTRGGGYGYNAGATCGPNRGGRRGGRGYQSTTYYGGGNFNGTVRTTRRALPQTCFNGNRRTRYTYSSCGTFYHQIIERRRHVPGRWVYVGCDRYWEPGYTTWVQVNTVPMYW